MNRNTNTLFLNSPGATTPIPWIDNAPDFSAFTEPTLSVLQTAWQEFLDSGEELEIIPDPKPTPEPPPPADWDGFNVFMLSDAMFKSYRDTVRAVDPELNTALFNAYGVVATNGIGAFAAIWPIWCQAAQITEQDKGTIADTAQSFNLPAEFISTL